MAAHHYAATISWRRNADAFADGRYSRAHTWDFDGSRAVAASASPLIVPLPLSTADAIDPEEAFVASLSSCHMLWFLDLAARRGFIVDRYVDQAEGILTPDGTGCLAMTMVTLRPRVWFSGARVPEESEHQKVHHDAHELCYIARSVKTDVRCVPSIERSHVAEADHDNGPTAVVRRFGDALNHGDIDTLASLLTDDTVFENTGPAPDGTRIEGKAAVLSFWRRWLLANPGATFETEAIASSGNHCTLRWVYRKVRNAQPWHLRGVDVFTVRDGQVAEKLSYVKG